MKKPNKRRPDRTKYRLLYKQVKIGRRYVVVTTLVGWRH